MPYASPEAKLANERRYSHRRRMRRQERRAWAGYYVVTRRDVRRLLHRYNGRCAYCGERDDMLGLDHVFPLARGGGIAARGFFRVGLGLVSGLARHGFNE